MQYYVGGHDALRTNGYAPIWPTRPTSQFGSNPDGLYVKSSTPKIVKQSITHVLIDSDFKLSDHAAILYTVPCTTR